MPKTVALHHPAGNLAASLAARGYKVMSLQEAVRFRVHVDAVLYTAHRPDTIPACHSALDAADISLGTGYEAAEETMPGAIMLNVAGKHPEAVAAELAERLHHHPWQM